MADVGQQRSIMWQWEQRANFPREESLAVRKITTGSLGGALRSKRSVGARPSTCSGVRRVFPM